VIYSKSKKVMRIATASVAWLAAIQLTKKQGYDWIATKNAAHFLCARFRSLAASQHLIGLLDIKK
jgi:LDH2 family malate/lactate/ureidoglycolate dehydrogenase